jgi:hypothetical protein
MRSIASLAPSISAQDSFISRKIVRAANFIDTIRYKKYGLWKKIALR